jgi:anti-anti-sigma regulatory factor
MAIREPVLDAELVFDVSAAWRLRDRVLACTGVMGVTLDFSHVRDCHTFAFAALLADLAASRHVPVRISGLSEDQHRLLRGLGLGPVESPSPTRGGGTQ